MKQWLWAAALILTVCCGAARGQVVMSFGDVLVDTVITIEDGFILRCEIGQWPPVIGLDMPVKIAGIAEPAGENTAETTPEQYEKARLLLEEKLRNARTVVLREIRRGETFSLYARVFIDGADVAEELIERGLATQAESENNAKNADKEEAKEPVFSSKSPESQARPAENTASGRSDSDAQQNQDAPNRNEEKTVYVASKSSKIFHRSDCPYAGTITDKNRIEFRSRDEAEKSGRRGCKRCNP